MGDFPAWGLDKGLTTPHHKNLECYETTKRLQTWTDPLVWNVTSLYMSGSGSATYCFETRHGDWFWEECGA